MLLRLAGPRSPLTCPCKYLAQATFNDHEAYAMVEEVENLLVDCVEADGNWREQWVVCDSLPYFLQTDLAEGLMQQV